MPVIGIDVLPPSAQVRFCALVVDKVASLAVVAVSLLGEGVALFCLVGAISVTVDLEFMGTVCELAALAIGTTAFLCVVFAEGGLGLRGATPEWA